MSGCATAGKSTLAKEIKNLSEEKFPYVGAEIRVIIPPKYHKKAIGFR